MLKILKLYGRSYSQTNTRKWLNNGNPCQWVVGMQHCISPCRIWVLKIYQGLCNRKGVSAPSNQTDFYSCSTALLGAPRFYNLSISRYYEKTGKLRISLGHNSHRFSVHRDKKSQVNKTVIMDKKAQKAGGLKNPPTKWNIHTHTKIKIKKRQ